MLTILATNASIKSTQYGNLYTNQPHLAEYINFQYAGIYTVIANSVSGQICDNIWPRMALSINLFPHEYQTIDSSSKKNYTYALNIDTPGTYTIGFTMINDGNNLTEDRNVLINSFSIISLNGLPDVTLSNASAWINTISSKENKLLSDANIAISTPPLRKDIFTINVLDSNNNGISGANITINQKTHDFLFGANLGMYNSFNSSTMNTTYKDKFKQIFNHATLLFYWKSLETDGYSKLDSAVDWCIQNNIIPKGHPILWNTEYGIPSTITGVPSQNEQYNHIKEVLTKYLTKIQMWDVVNEPVNEPGIDINYPHMWAKEINSNIKIGVNEFGHFYEGFEDFYDFLTQKINNNVQIDRIGMQAHAPQDMAFPLETINYVLNKYSTFNKEIHITELTFPSDNSSISRSTWRGMWTEANQAKYIEDFYRICFAHPSIYAISWWDFSDQGAWKTNSGLLRSDLSTKPAYESLNNLINSEWKTNVSGETIGGKFNCSCFYGKYDISIVYNDTTQVLSNLHLEKNMIDKNIYVYFDVNLSIEPDPMSVSINSFTTPTKNSKPTFTGTCQNATSIMVSVNGINWYSAIINGSTWSITWPISLSNGSYLLQAKAYNVLNESIESINNVSFYIDIIPPVITILGNNPTYIKKGSTYQDLGATAVDNLDGNITSKIITSGKINTKIINTQNITYTVSDSAGNKTTAIRYVKILK